MEMGGGDGDGRWIWEVEYAWYLGVYEVCTREGVKSTAVGLICRLIGLLG